VIQARGYLLSKSISGGQFDNIQMNMNMAKIESGTNVVDLTTTPPTYFTEGSNLEICVP
jgi:hypothetical protein